MALGLSECDAATATQPRAGWALQRLRTSFIVRPIAAGDSVMVTPALRSASILSAAVPLPPAMIAPACPIRRPGGAAAPAINPTVGFLRRAALRRAAPSS